MIVVVHVLLVEDLVQLGISVDKKVFPVIVNDAHTPLGGEKAFNRFYEGHWQLYVYV